MRFCLLEVSIVNSEISELSNNIIIKAKDVVYFENIFPFKSRVPFDSFSILSSSDISSSSSTPTTDIEPMRSKRTKMARGFREDFFIYILKVILDPSRKQLIHLNFFPQRSH